MNICFPFYFCFTEGNNKSIHKKGTQKKAELPQCLVFEIKMQEIVWSTGHKERERTPEREREREKFL